MLIQTLLDLLLKHRLCLMFPQNQLKPEHSLSLKWNEVLRKVNTLICRLFFEYMVNSKAFQMSRMGHSTKINSDCKQLPVLFKESSVLNVDWIMNVISVFRRCKSAI